MHFHTSFGPIGCGWYPDVLTSKRQRVEELPLKNEGLVLAKSKYTLGSIQKLKAYVIRKSNFKESFYKGSLRHPLPLCK